jgi:hypothetical protein
MMALARRPLLILDPYEPPPDDDEREPCPLCGEPHEDGPDGPACEVGPASGPGVDDVLLVCVACRSTQVQPRTADPECLWCCGPLVEGPKTTVGSMVASRRRTA